MAQTVEVPAAALPQKPIAPAIPSDDREIIVQFCDPSGAIQGPELTIPRGIAKSEIESLLNTVLANEEFQSYAFSIERSAAAASAAASSLTTAGSTASSVEITTTLSESFSKLGVTVGSERVLLLHYHPLAAFRVSPVTQCAASLEGHADSVLCLAFSPDGTELASGSGDTTVRIWDLWTKTPKRTLKGHANWVLCLAWAPTGKLLASAGMDKTLRVWRTASTESGAAVEKSTPLTGHTSVVTCLAWQPLHLVDDDNPSGEAGGRTTMTPLLVSASKDCTLMIWDVVRGCRLKTLTGHTKMVTSVRWSGSGVIFSGSRDTTIRVWDHVSGHSIKELRGHGHWVNHIALNTDQVLRAGAIDHKRSEFTSWSEQKALAKKRYEETVGATGGEKLLSCSDDLTMFLWTLTDLKKPLARMSGHQQPVNHVSFSPDGRLFASASFDKSVRLWNGRTGKFVATFRGHVGRVYQVCWSADSRLLLSVSADSTLKTWDVVKSKMKEDLPGHADEVYAVDWSLSSGAAASGGKDKVVKIWVH